MTHELILKVTDEEDDKITAEVHVHGSGTKLSMGLLAAMQHDPSLVKIIMETIVNGMLGAKGVPERTEEAAHPN